VSEPDWYRLAACAGKGHLFFDADSAPTAARLFCTSCPVRIECAAEAVRLIERDELAAGVWAGVNVAHSDALVRLRRIAGESGAQIQIL
jgi:hypothetical protein